MRTLEEHLQGHGPFGRLLDGFVDNALASTVDLAKNLVTFNRVSNRLLRQAGELVTRGSARTARHGSRVVPACFPELAE